MSRYIPSVYGPCMIKLGTQGRLAVTYSRTRCE